MDLKNADGTAYRGYATVTDKDRIATTVKVTNGLLQVTIDGSASAENRRAIIADLSDGITYTVTENETFGWKVKSKTNDTGTIRATTPETVSVATFTNVEAGDLTVSKEWYFNETPVPVPMDATNLAKMQSKTFKLYQTTATVSAAGPMNQAAAQALIPSATEIVTFTLPEAGQWSKTIIDLPTDDDQGNTYHYFVVEQEVEDDTQYAYDHDKHEWTVKNYEDSEFNIYVEKKWMVGETEVASDPTMPESITVQLQQAVPQMASDGYDWANYGEPLTLNAGNNWKGTFYNLPIKVYIDRDRYYSYRVVETGVGGWTTEYSQNNKTWFGIRYGDTVNNDIVENGYKYTQEERTVTITNTKEDAGLLVQKQWYVNGVRVPNPSDDDAVRVKLVRYKAEKDTQNYILDEDFWYVVPKPSIQKDIDRALSELLYWYGGDNWENWKYDASRDTGWTEQVWIEYYNNYKNLLQTARAKLAMYNQESDSVVTLNNTNGWRYNFTDLTTSHNIYDYKYAVVEVKEAGNQIITEYSPDGGTTWYTETDWLNGEVPYADFATGTVPATCIIRNTKKGSLAVEKVLQASTSNPVKSDVTKGNGCVVFTISGPAPSTTPIKYVKIYARSNNLGHDRYETFYTYQMADTEAGLSTAEVKEVPAGGVVIDGLEYGTYTIKEGKWVFGSFTSQGSGENITWTFTPGSLPENYGIYLKDVEISNAAGDADLVEKTATVEVGGTTQYTGVPGATFTNELVPNTVNVEKQIQDINDSTATTNNNGDSAENPHYDSADYDVGDRIPYRVRGYLPQATYKSLSSYYYEVIDQMVNLTLERSPEDVHMYAFVKPGEVGAWYQVDDYFTFNWDVSTKTLTAATKKPEGLKAITEGHYVTYWGGSDTHDNKKFQNSNVEWQSIKTPIDPNNIEYLELRYWATLDADANIGNDKTNTTDHTSTWGVAADTGNPNAAQIKYTNLSEVSGYGYTPWDVNKVFTYKLKVNKKDGRIGGNLNGADFALFKGYSLYPNASCNSTVPSGWVQCTYDTHDTYYTMKSQQIVTLIGPESAMPDGATTTPVEEGTTFNGPVYVYVEKTSGNTAGHEFVWNCVDDGYYVLIETTTPEHYASLPGAITIKISAEHEGRSPDPQLIINSNGDTSISARIDGTYDSTYIDNSMNMDLGQFALALKNYPHGNLELSKTVVAAEGSTLPSGYENQAFDFTVTLTAPSASRPLPATVPVTIVSASDNSVVTAKANYTVTATQRANGKITAGTIAVSLKRGQKALMEELPAGATYSIAETSVPGYTLTWDTNKGATGTIPAMVANGAATNAKAEAAAINTFNSVPFTPEAAKMLNGVAFNGKLGDGTTPATFTFDIRTVTTTTPASGETPAESGETPDESGETPAESGETPAESGEMTTYTVSDGQPIQSVTTGQNGAITFSPIKYNTAGTYYYQISEQATFDNGTMRYADPIYLKVEVDDALTTATGTYYSDANFTTEISGTPTFNNTEVTRIEAQKLWYNPGDITSTVTRASVTFTLMKVTGDDATQVEQEGLTNPVTITLDENATASESAWVATWENLPKYKLDQTTQTLTAIVYNVVETDATIVVDGVVTHLTETSTTTVNGNGYTIVNTLPKTSIEVTKLWKDSRGVDRVFTSKSVDFTLYQKIGDSAAMVYTAYGTNGRGTITYHPAVEAHDDKPAVPAHWDTVTISNLEKYVYVPGANGTTGQWKLARYYVVEDSISGVSIAYTVEDDPGETGYTVSDSGDSTSFTPVTPTPQSEDNMETGAEAGSGDTTGSTSGNEADASETVRTITITNTDEQVDLVIVKADSESIPTSSSTPNPLSGAAFELLRVKDDNATLTYPEATAIFPRTSGTNNLTGTDGLATFSNLAAGYYKVTETQAPAGYILTNSVFYIKVDSGEIKLMEWVLKENSESEHEWLERTDAGPRLWFSAAKADTADAHLTGTATVGNEKGARLPNSGGPGTTLFYVVGSIITLLAAVLLVTKRRSYDGD